MTYEMLHSLYAFLTAYTIIMAITIAIVEAIVFGFLTKMNDRKTGNSELHHEERHLFMKLLLTNIIVIFFMYFFRYKMKFDMSVLTQYISQGQFRVAVSVGLKFLLLCGLAFRKRTSGFFLMTFIFVCITTSIAYEASPEVMKAIYPFFKDKRAATTQAAH